MCLANATLSAAALAAVNDHNVTSSAKGWFANGVRDCTARTSSL
ncbi:hypothetical protein [Streptomyces laculatispora]|nr:hypothetical protein [Streptomyces laculatispora]